MLSLSFMEKWEDFDVVLQTHLEIFEGAGRQAEKGQPSGTGCLGFHEVLEKARRSSRKPWNTTGGPRRAGNRSEGNSSHNRKAP